MMPAHRGRIHEYIGGTIRSMNGIAHAVGGMGDHVHIFAGLCATHCLADLMREIKSESSRWIRTELHLPGFAWQEGYGGFTVSASHIEAVRAYVLNQEEHHRTKTFQEEYVAMLKRGLVEYDEAYPVTNGGTSTASRTPPGRTALLEPPVVPLRCTTG